MKAAVAGRASTAALASRASALTRLDLPALVCPATRMRSGSARTLLMAALSAAVAGDTYSASASRRHAQSAAVEIDRRAADLAHIRFRDPSRDLVAAPLHERLGKLLARFLRRRRDRIGEPDEPPDVVGALDVVDRAAPAIEAQRLRNRHPVAERYALDQEQAKPAG